MKLPVTTASPDPAVLWRRYADLLGDRLLAIGEDASASYGRAVVDGKDGFALLTEEAAADAYVAVAEHLGRSGVGRITWVLPPRAAVPTFRALRQTAFTLFRLERWPFADADPAWSVLPGRAARGRYEQVCATTADPADPFSARRLAHLDDPQFDGMVLLSGHAALAAGGLQSRGQTGGVFDLGVVPAARRQGVGGYLLGRLLELAARAQLADVFTAAATDDPPSVTLSERAGFVAFTRYAVVTTSAAVD